VTESSEYEGRSSGGLLNTNPRIYRFMILAVNGGVGSATCSSHFREDIPRYPIY